MLATLTAIPQEFVDQSRFEFSRCLLTLILTALIVGMWAQSPGICKWFERCVNIFCTAVLGGFIFLSWWALSLLLMLDVPLEHGLR